MTLKFKENIGETCHIAFSPCKDSMYNLNN